MTARTPADDTGVSEGPLVSGLDTDGGSALAQRLVESLMSLANTYDAMGPGSKKVAGRIREAIQRARESR